MGSEKSNCSLARPAMTLVEVIVALTIVGTLAALALVAIMAARGSAAQTQSRNNLRQLINAVHNFASQYNGSLPDVQGDRAGPNPRTSMFEALLPYVEDQKAVFVDPADPSAALTAKASLASYAANAMVFIDNAKLPASIPDGTSQTIGLAQRYAECQSVTFEIYSLWMMPSSLVRATFADGGMAWPVTSGTPPVSQSVSAPYHASFQVAPSIQDCDPWVPQTPYRSGMDCAFMDGSVRILSANTPPAIFWGAVTPAGGEEIEIGQ